MRASDEPALGSSKVVIAVLALSINFGVVFFDRNAVGFLIPFIQPDLKLTNTEIGALAGVLAFAWAISGYAIGHLADKYGRRKLIILVSTAIFSFSSFITGIAWSFASLFVARLLMGLSEGAVMPVSQSLTSELVPETRRGLAMGAMQAFGSNLLGGMVAPLVLVGLASQFGWRATFYMTAVPGLICVGLVALLVPDSRKVRSSDGHAAPHEPLRLSKLFGRNIVLCCLISICLVAYNSICWYFVPVFLTQERGLNAGVMSWLVAMLGLSAVCTAFLVPGLSDKLGRKPVMIVFSAIGVLMPMSALLLPASFVAMAPGFFIGWAVLGVYPIFMSIIPIETVGSASAAKVLGLVVGTGELFGGGLGPSVAGFVSDLSDLSAALWIMAALSAIAAVLSLGLIETAPARTRNAALI